jgi:hypothetical protein
MIKDEPAALGTTAIDLLTRHLLAGMREEFHRRVLMEPGGDKSPWRTTTRDSLPYLFGPG